MERGEAEMRKDLRKKYPERGYTGRDTEQKANLSERDKAAFTEVEKMSGQR